MQSTTDKMVMLGNYYKIHSEQVSKKILTAVFLFLLLSVVWNVAFLLFGLPFSRANPILLLSCLGAWFFVVLGKRFFNLSATVFMHFVLLFMVLVVCCLYFGSGYREAWVFFLLIPLISGFYGDRLVLILYSLLGLVMMVYVGFQYPIVAGIFDSIDLANRILLYIIIATFSHLLLRQLNQLYDTQVNTIMESADASIRQVVKTFIIAVEAKDAYTFGHSERVGKYAIELARSLPEYEDKKKLQCLYMSGLLHDIGKINIPEQVLTKEGALTEEEYELIKSHPFVGGRMVEKLPMLGSLKPGVLYHHEKWDGSGYPAGIKGEEIPLDARILAIADVFDAITSKRSYREALPPERAFEIIEQGKGTHFDPNLVEKLMEMKDKWLEVYYDSGDELKEFEQLTEFL